MSCAGPHSFQKFYNDEKRDADIAISVPKYMAMIAIPRREKNEIKPFLKGMKKVRFLYHGDENNSLIESFGSFVSNKNYTPYFYMKDDGNKVNLFAKEEDGYIKEIVIDVNSDDETVILALMGKMKKETFEMAISEVSKNQ